MANPPNIPFWLSLSKLRPRLARRLQPCHPGFIYLVMRSNLNSLTASSPRAPDSTSSDGSSELSHNGLSLKPQKAWYVYLIECRDGSLYTGIAVDVALRFAQHVAGTGAKYTRSHPPLRLLGYCQYPGRAEASRAEYRVKQLTPTRKRALCAEWLKETVTAAL